MTDPAAGTGTDSITGLAAGYYLIKNTSVEEGEVYTDYILQVVKNVEVNPKSGKPTLDKQIRHDETGIWGVVGDNQIGDTVEFRTLTTVPIVPKEQFPFLLRTNFASLNGVLLSPSTFLTLILKVQSYTIFSGVLFVVVPCGLLLYSRYAL